MAKPAILIIGDRAAGWSINPRFSLPADAPVHILLITCPVPLRR